MSDLSDLLEAHRHDDESNRDIAEAIGVAPATVDKYMNGTHGTASERILRGFSDYFKIPIEKLRTANGVPAGERGRWLPPPESDRLSRGQRKALDQLIRTIVVGASSDESKPGQRINATAARTAKGVRVKKPKQGNKEGA